MRTALASTIPSTATSHNDVKAKILSAYFVRFGPLSTLIFPVQSGALSTEAYPWLTHRIGLLGVDAGSKVIPVISRGPPLARRTLLIVLPAPSVPSSRMS